MLNKSDHRQSNLRIFNFEKLFSWLPDFGNIVFMYACESENYNTLG